MLVRADLWELKHDISKSKAARRSAFKKLEPQAAPVTRLPPIRAVCEKESEPVLQGR